MILSVTFEKTTYNALPVQVRGRHADIAGAIGLGAAIDYLDARRASSRSPRTSSELLAYATERALGDAAACGSSARRARRRA